jgi:hypothetical protein
VLLLTSPRYPFALGRMKSRQDGQAHCVKRILDLLLGVSDFDLAVRENGIRDSLSKLYEIEAGTDPRMLSSQSLMRGWVGTRKLVCGSWEERRRDEACGKRLLMKMLQI